MSTNDSSNSNLPGPDQQVRVRFDLPVFIKGHDTQGDAFAEGAMAENVARRGAFLRTSRQMADGAPLVVFADGNDERWLCDTQVVWFRAEPGKDPGVGVKLVGSNAEWMAYLIEHSIQAEEGEAPEQN
jgi:hypothetical protein